MNRGGIDILFSQEKCVPVRRLPDSRRERAFIITSVIVDECDRLFKEEEKIPSGMSPSFHHILSKNKQKRGKNGKYKS